jgi:hypothetical protein
MNALEWAILIFACFGIGMLPGLIQIWLKERQAQDMIAWLDSEARVSNDSGVDIPALFDAANKSTSLSVRGGSDG